MWFLQISQLEQEISELSSQVTRLKSSAPPTSAGGGDGISKETVMDAFRSLESELLSCLREHKGRLAAAASSSGSTTAASPSVSSLPRPAPAPARPAPAPAPAPASPAKVSPPTPAMPSNSEPPSQARAPEKVVESGVSTESSGNAPWGIHMLRKANT